MGTQAQTIKSPATLVGSVTGLAEGMRPVQWVKNGFVLAPVVFSGMLSDPIAVFRELSAFGAFCLAASGIYLWNDTLDWRSDAVHPDKRKRPIPSGRLSPTLAVMFGSLLLVASLLLGLKLSIGTGMLLSSYVVVNLLYTFRLKHIAILDLMCIAVGFVLRVIAGATSINVQASHWLLMCTFLLALFLGIAKRRQELVTLADKSDKHRRVLASYSLPWLDQAGTVLAGAAIVAYALYTVAPETQARFGTDNLIFTLPFVVYGIMRYLHQIHMADSTGNPTSALLTDRQLLLCIFAWGASCTAIIYL